MSKPKINNARTVRRAETRTIYRKCFFGQTRGMRGLRAQFRIPILRYVYLTLYIIQQRYMYSIVFQQECYVL